MTSRTARGWMRWARGVFAVGTGMLCLSVRAAETSKASAAIAALDRAIMMRTAPDGKIYGRNEIDPLIWRDSVEGRAGEARGRGQGALKRVTELADAEVKRCSAAQRALVQNRVWTVFDHVRAHTGARTAADREYLQLLARTMAKLALDKKEIAAITDPLAEAAASNLWPSQPTLSGGPDVFLPAGIAEEGGAWTTLGRSDGWVNAKQHTTGFGGRSLFFVRVNFPKGSAGPAAYFKAIADFPAPWVFENDPNFPLSPHFVANPDLPELPAGAEFALVRRLAVIDREGRWQSTPLTLSMQLRHYRVTNQKSLEKLRAQITSPNDPGPLFDRLQSFAEFDLETTVVSEGERGMMKPVRSADKSWFFMLQMGSDQVDGTIDGRTLDNFPTGPQGVAMFCVQCHSGLGVRSVNSLMFITTAQTVKLGGLTPLAPADEAERTALRKTEQADWGALQAFWPAAETTAPVH
mgnify:FL=1